MSQEYAKGWQDEKLRAAFKAAMYDNDCQEVAAIVLAQGADRPPVDTFVFGMPQTHRRAERTAPDPVPGLETPEFKKELELVQEVSKMRDVKLVDLPKTLPRGMRVLSPALADVLVPQYSKGVDYGRRWEGIQRGDRVPPVQTSGSKTKIVTARDAAAYVHKDNPMTPFVWAVEFFLSENVPQKMPKSMETMYPGQQNFTVFGLPFFLKMLADAVVEGGWVSFRAKWKNFRMRPEESSIVVLDAPLLLAYPEGSPMHPSLPAMHSFAAWVQAYLLMLFFDKNHVLSTGDTVEEFLTLLCDNVGLFRVLAGVHYPSDHTSYKPVAKAVASSIAGSYLK